MRPEGSLETCRLLKSAVSSRGGGDEPVPDNEEALELSDGGFRAYRVRRSDGYVRYDTELMRRCVRTVGSSPWAVTLGGTAPALPMHSA